MKQLKHIGEGYHGTSPDGSLVFAKPGDVVEVCDEKAAQLLYDFPKEWEPVVTHVEEKSDEKAAAKKEGKGKK